MVAEIAAMLGIAVDRVSIKATTNEKTRLRRPRGRHCGHCHGNVIYPGEVSA